MAVIDLTRANRVEIVESIEQMTLAAAEEITPGMAVRVDGDRFTKANGSSEAEAGAYGIATGDVVVVAGMAVTAVRQGVLDGYDLTGDTGDAVYLSDTDGRLDTVAGTTERQMGTVIPGTAAPRGVTHKLLHVSPQPIVAAGGGD